MVNLLISFDVDVNQADGGIGNTGVMWCAHKNEPEMIEFLIEKGADVFIQNNEGQDALDIAVYWMSFHAAKVLY